MASSILIVAVTVVVGALALLAHWARKSRGAEISLWIALLFSSLIFLLLGIFSAAGLIVAAGGASSISTAAAISTGVVLVVGGLMALGLFVAPIKKITSHNTERGFWSDPPVFLALWLFVVVMSNNITSFFLFDQTGQMLAGMQQSGGSTQQLIITQELPFVVIAALGVGLGISRGPRQTLARLGYGRVSLPQLGIVLAFVVGALALSGLASALFAYLQPDLYQRVGEITESLINTRGLSPLSAVLLGLLVGLAAGIGEESLFRGAVQPVLGIIPTSVLFASMHVQYGLSVVLGYIFLLSLGLGILRKRINTTASFLAHALYNFASVLLAYFGMQGF